MVSYQHSPLTNHWLIPYQEIFHQIFHCDLFESPWRSRRGPTEFTAPNFLKSWVWLELPKPGSCRSAVGKKTNRANHSTWTHSSFNENSLGWNLKIIIFPVFHHLRRRCQKIWDRPLLFFEKCLSLHFFEWNSHFSMAINVTFRFGGAGLPGPVPPPSPAPVPPNPAEPRPRHSHWASPCQPWHGNSEKMIMSLDKTKKKRPKTAIRCFSNEPNAPKFGTWFCFIEIHEGGSFRSHPSPGQKRVVRSWGLEFYSKGKENPRINVFPWFW